MVLYEQLPDQMIKKTDLAMCMFDAHLEYKCSGSPGAARTHTA